MELLSSPETGTEKRRYPRYRVDLPLRVRDQSEQNHDGRCLVIGPGGLGAAIPEWLSLGSVVLLDFTLPNHPTDLHIWGVVRYQQEAQHGMEFVSTTDPEQLSIRQFCNELAVQTAKNDAFSDQQKRIRNLLDERAVGTVVNFDESGAPHRIKFVMVDPINNVILGTRETQQVSEVAAWSDDQLWAYIKKIAAERL